MGNSTRSHGGAHLAIVQFRDWSDFWSVVDQEAPPMEVGALAGTWSALLRFTVTPGRMSPRMLTHLTDDQITRLEQLAINQGLDPNHSNDNGDENDRARRLASRYDELDFEWARSRART